MWHRDMKQLNAIGKIVSKHNFNSMQGCHTLSICKKHSISNMNKVYSIKPCMPAFAYIFHIMTTLYNFLAKHPNSFSFHFY